LFFERGVCNSFHCFFSMNKILLLAAFALPLLADLPTPVIDGSGPGWKELTESDFMDVNCGDETWSWNGNSVACTGEPSE